MSCTLVSHLRLPTLVHLTFLSFTGLSNFKTTPLSHPSISTSFSLSSSTKAGVNETPWFPPSIRHAAWTSSLSVKRFWTVVISFPGMISIKSALFSDPDTHEILSSMWAKSTGFWHPKVRLVFELHKLRSMVMCFALSKRLLWDAYKIYSQEESISSFCLAIS